METLKRNETDTLEPLTLCQSLCKVLCTSIHLNDLQHFDEYYNYFAETNMKFIEIKKFSQY